MIRRPNRTKTFRAYTIIEALVASSVLLIGISAAASMSLSLLTQEEINERSVTVFNYLDNAARLYQLGMPESQIKAILPVEPAVTSLTTATASTAVPQIGNVDVVTLTVSYQASEASAVNDTSIDEWTGGDKDTTRNASVSVIRANSYIPENLPRVQKYGP